MEKIECITIILRSEKIKFSVPIEIPPPTKVRSVTWHGNLGKDEEYIVKNDCLGIKVKASNEKRGISYFEEEFKRKVCEVMLIEDSNLANDKIELKQYMKYLIVEEVINKDFETYLFEEKRKLSEDVANRICKERNLPIPFINFEGCPYEEGDQLAHYHPEYNCICISKRQLSLLNFNEIIEVMTHEVTHILVLHHGDKFSKEEAISKICGWTPPPGASIIHSNDRPLPESLMEKMENAYKRLQEEIQEKNDRKSIPLMPRAPTTQEVIENAQKVQGDLDGLRIELMKEELEKKLEETYDAYEKSDGMSGVNHLTEKEEERERSSFRKLFCKIGIHKWSRKRYVSNWNTGERYTKRYCKICGKKQFGK